MAIPEEYGAQPVEPTEYEASVEYRRAMDPYLAVTEREETRRAFVHYVNAHPAGSRPLADVIDAIAPVAESPTSSDRAA